MWRESSSASIHKTFSRKLSCPLPIRKITFCISGTRLLEDMCLTLQTLDIQFGIVQCIFCEFFRITGCLGQLMHTSTNFGALKLSIGPLQWPQGLESLASVGFEYVTSWSTSTY